MAYYRRSRASARRRTTRGYTRSSTRRRTGVAGRARASSRGRNGAQVVRLVIESGASSLVQRPDGMMAARTQPTDGKAKF